MSELHAKCKLEEYLKKKYDTFSKLVIYKCNRDVMGIFGDMFGMNKSNPFGF
ncbi:MAG: hypothetical protein M0R17_07455 [Candidatus Omnitrophica bacterium]|nr:hypothetical protein [Candidatus Omnitrophota bacterium]